MNNPKINNSITPLLARMDVLFDGFFEWLEGQYDPASGGFFYARSSRDSGQFTPDIESTAQALNIMERTGLMENMHPQMKEGLIRFFQRKQDAATGYFYEDHPDMRDDEVMVGRAIGYSVASLHKLGARPLYPLPVHDKAPAYMTSPAAYLEWLKHVELSNSWRGCDRLCNSAPYIRALPVADRAPYLLQAFRFLERIQDKETGLWGQGTPYVRISGTFKLLTYYRGFHMAVPRQDLIYRSIQNCLRTETAKDMCYIRNPIDLLGAMENFPVPPEEFAEIVEITVNNMSKLKRPDGGFSRELHRSPPATNVAQVKEDEYYPNMPKPVPLGLGLVEGDMNASTQAFTIRGICRHLAGQPLPILAPSGMWKDL